MIRVDNHKTTWSSEFSLTKTKILFFNYYAMSNWRQNFIECFNSGKKTKAFNTSLKEELEKKELLNLKALYENGEIIINTKIGRKLYDRMRTLKKKYFIN